LAQKKYDHIQLHRKTYNLPKQTYNCIEKHIIHTKNERKKEKNRTEHVKMKKKNDIPIWVCSVPMVFCGYHSVTGMGFAGTGMGWATRTRAIPMCHPTHGHGPHDPCPHGTMRNKIKIKIKYGI